jgi:hypothetical protein
LTWIALNRWVKYNISIKQVNFYVEHWH